MWDVVDRVGAEKFRPTTRPSEVTHCQHVMDVLYEGLSVNEADTATEVLNTFGRTFQSVATSNLPASQKSGVDETRSTDNFGIR